MTSFVDCPECGRKLRVPDSAKGKSFRCPACKTIISSESLLEEIDPDSDELDTPSPAPSIQTGPSSKSVPPSSRRRPPDEEREEDMELVEEEPVREKPARRKRPKRKKSSTGLIVGLVAGGIILILLVLGVGGGLLWYIFRGRTVPQGEWQSFNPPNSDCTILMPGSPQSTPLTVNGVTISKYLVERKRENAFFAISYAELPVETLPAGILDLMINAERDNLMRIKPGSQVALESPISFGNLPGRELQLKPPPRGTLIERLYLAKVGNTHRFYLLALGGDYLQAESGDVVRFFESFKINVPVMPPVFAGAAGGGGGKPLPDIKPPQANPQSKMPRPNPGPGFRPPRGPRKQP